MKFILNNFLVVLILGLSIFLLAVSNCNHKETVKPIVVVDTLWVRHDSIVLSKPKLIYSIGPVRTNLIREIQYIPDTNYKALLKQYNALLFLYLSKNIQKDTLKLNKFGYVAITDTVYKNLVADRKYDYHINYPIVTQKTAYRTNQLYLGGGFQGDKINLVNQVNVGLLLKTKKDYIFGVSVGFTDAKTAQYSVSYYNTLFK
jgi:hypothetical protein